MSSLLVNMLVLPVCNNPFLAGTLPKLYDRPSRTAYYKISSWPLVTQVRQTVDWTVL